MMVELRCWEWLPLMLVITQVVPNDRVFQNNPAIVVLVKIFQTKIRSGIVKFRALAVQLRTPTDTLLNMSHPSSSKLGFSPSFAIAMAIKTYLSCGGKSHSLSNSVYSRSECHRQQVDVGLYCDLLLVSPTAERYKRTDHVWTDAAAGDDEEGLPARNDLHASTESRILSDCDLFHE